MITIAPQDIDYSLRLLVSAFLGGLIGLERESQGKDAGIRTYALVSLGSALIMIVSIQIYDIYGGKTVDPSRIAAQVVSGIGFLGAGAIMRFNEGTRNSIKGLTTAASIWAASGIGLACGIKMYHSAVLTTVFCLVILVFFAKIDKFFGGKDY